MKNDDTPSKLAALPVLHPAQHSLLEYTLLGLKSLVVLLSPAQQIERNLNFSQVTEVAEWICKERGARTRRCLSSEIFILTRCTRLPSTHGFAEASWASGEASTLSCPEGVPLGRREVCLTPAVSTAPCGPEGIQAQGLVLPHPLLCAARVESHLECGGRIHCSKRTARPPPSLRGLPRQLRAQFQP
ncbi:hypothetical protein P7K49_037667 [Saguinus oedipus]|uniref:Uncharacterized protein n=1 Tax=Saguinus oedipus TaxID=9490 RepID=A0ABQ9TIP8_SAGOE|nr:hypothetical protein P7K49_037667 [Saguinus oedipus]